MKHHKNHSMPFAVLMLVIAVVFAGLVSSIKRFDNESGAISPVVLFRPGTGTGNGPGSEGELSSVSSQGERVILFEGNVQRGQTFVKKIAGNLLFRLRPDDNGWSIEVADAGNPDLDFVWVATPPYRSDNPRYLGTAYGHSAEDAAAWSPRHFGFALDAAGYQEAFDAVTKAAYSKPSDAKYGEKEIADAQDFLTSGRMKRGEGSLTILNATFGGTTAAGEKERIESLEFRVDIRLPINIVAALHKEFLKEHTDYQTMQEACPNSREPIHAERVVRYDFDGDGFDETVVLASSCFSGTGGADILKVLKLLDSGEVTALIINNQRIFGGRAIYQDTRGKMSFYLVNGKLVTSFPVYKANDPNCCPSAGLREITYRWNGAQFIVENVADRALAAQ